MCFFCYVFALFSSKLSRKDKKFPSSLISSFYVSNLLTVIFTFIAQKANNSDGFMKICFLIKVLLEFYSSFLNILFFISVIFYFFYVKLNIKRPELLTKYSNVITIIWDIIAGFMIIFPFIYFIFFKLKLKHCFLGSCLINKDLNFQWQIVPFLLETFFLWFIFINFLIFYYLRIEEINNCDDSFDKEIIELNEEHKEFLKKEKEAFLISFRKVIIFEFIYMFLVCCDSTIKYQKYKAFNLSRYENYCSIHDYLIIFKGFLVFFCLTLNKENYKEWKKAFDDYDDDYFEETSIDCIVDSVITVKNKINKNT
jgi:hypothetical protein